MHQRNIVLAGLGIGFTVSLAALGMHLARKKGIKQAINDWKDERIRSAYYATITEKDIAWG